MREIISLHIGQCGVHVGAMFWQTVCGEHSIENTGLFAGSDCNELPRLPVFFSESSTGRFVPRNLFIDLESGDLNYIRSRSSGALYHPDNFLFYSRSAQNNFAKGYFGDGARLAEVVRNRCRKMIEVTECFQGFQVTHAIGGGTGSGTASNIMQLLMNEFMNDTIFSYTVFPSHDVSNVVVETYNSVFALNTLINFCDNNICMENESLYRICNEQCQIADPEYSHLNELAALVMSGNSASLRFPSQLSCDLRKMTLNLVPFPQLHFCSASYAPNLPSRELANRKFKPGILMDMMFSRDNIMCSMDNPSLYTACAITFRGEVMPTDVDMCVYRMQRQYSENFVKWIPGNLKTAIVARPPKNVVFSCNMVGNNLAIKGVFDKLKKNFEQLYSKRSFTHYYLSEGLSEEYFSEASAALTDLIGEYELWYGTEETQ